MESSETDLSKEIGSKFETETTRNPSYAVHFPFLLGFEPSECSDPISKTTLSRLRKKVKCGPRAKVAKPHASLIKKLTRENPRLSCHFCVEDFEANPYELLQHCISSDHLDKVMAAGRVFSHSNDFILAKRTLKNRRKRPDWEAPSHFPLLLGFQPTQCEDGISSQTMANVVKALLNGCGWCLTDIASSLGYVLRTLGFRSSRWNCSTCGEKFRKKDVQLCFRHCLSEEHLQKVGESGMVFSLSKDLMIICEIFEKAGKLGRVDLRKKIAKNLEQVKGGLTIENLRSGMYDDLIKKATDVLPQQNEDSDSRNWEVSVCQEINTSKVYVVDQTSPTVKEDKEHLSSSLNEPTICEEGHFPFLTGFQRSQLPDDDIITGKQVLAKFELNGVNGSMQGLSSLLRALKHLTPGKCLLICNFCKDDSFQGQPCRCLRHCISQKHISKVRSSGAVFSRTKDLNVLLRIIEQTRNPREVIAEPKLVANDEGKISVRDLDNVTLTQCPLLTGFSPDDCPDAVSPKSVQTLLDSLCKDRVDLSYFRGPLLFSKFAVSDCVYCEKTFNQRFDLCFAHCMTKRHLQKVEEAGMVFSQSKDCDVFRELLEQARVWTKVKEEKASKRKVEKEKRKLILQEEKQERERLNAAKREERRLKAAEKLAQVTENNSSCLPAS